MGRKTPSTRCGQVTTRGRMSMDSFAFLSEISFVFQHILEMSIADRWVRIRPPTDGFCRLSLRRKRGKHRTRVVRFLIASLLPSPRCLLHHLPPKGHLSLLHTKKPHIRNGRLQRSMPLAHRHRLRQRLRDGRHRRQPLAWRDHGLEPGTTGTHLPSHQIQFYDRRVVSRLIGSTRPFRRGCDFHLPSQQ